jgi:phytanoyl-CoA hydroxylase
MARGSGRITYIARMRPPLRSSRLPPIQHSTNIIHSLNNKMATAVQTPPTPAHALVYEPSQLPKLRSNYGAYLQDANVGWMRPTPIDTPLAELRRRFETDGYVWVKNVMPRKDVLDMREAYFTHLSPTGILKPGTSPREGIFDPTQDPVAHNGVGGRDLPDDIERVEKLVEVHKHPFYLAFLEHPKLRAFVREFMGWERDVLVKRTLLRHNVPNGLSTGVHYDRLFLRAGEADFLTAWVPIGDVAAEGGGLVYLEHSDDIGREMEAGFMERNMELPDEERVSGFNVNMARDGQLTHDIEGYTKDLESAPYRGRNTRRWLVGNYEAGDVVFHNPYLLHGASKNEDPLGRIRLSTDLRFYEEGAALDTRWMRDVWSPDDGL